MDLLLSDLGWRILDTLAFAAIICAVVMAVQAVRWALPRRDKPE